MNARPAPRKSSLAGTSPVAPAPAPAIPAPAPSAGAAAPNTSAPAKPKPKHPPKVSFYQDPADTQRMRGAIRVAMAQEGSRGLSDFIHNAVMREVERLERRYNDGRPFGPAGAGELPQGRPMGE